MARSQEPGSKRIRTPRVALQVASAHTYATTSRYGIRNLSRPSRGAA
ncbi:hypothetical protein I603_0858 [Erythrobacter dokdonensis DSW-74]|uniref:Uncharacterized protein n=1 Tax=Erythrobacter dokdonensis DSW-74 TaxID=1300349 RepID=A0A1A7BJQ0_9SPHN|nr:hypothetical protein I603_0858 [Erythrobacter dokdonensis DSW-74]